MMILVALFAAPVAQAATLTAVDFKYGTPKSELVITTDDAVSMEKSVSEEDNQVIIDVRGATVPKKLARKTDTSQFKSNVALISVYQKGSDARIVLQLKGSGAVDVSQDGSRVVAAIDNGTGAAAKATAGADDSLDTLSPDAAATVVPDTASAAAAPVTETETVAPPEPAALAATDPDTIESFMDSQASRKYVGTKITIQMMNAELQDIFRIIANASDFNIILSDKVTGKMSLDLVDVPWDQVLDIVLKSNKLAAERVANILRVLPATDLQAEKDSELQMKVAAEMAEPLVTKIFPISYALPLDIQRILTPYLSRDPRQTATVRGNIEVDRRSNSLIVRDTPSTIEKFKRIIKELDAQTPQVLIEGKFVEVRESHSRAFQGQLYATTRNNEGGTFDFHPRTNNYGFVFGNGTAGGSATSALALSPASSGVSMGFAPKAALLPGIPDLAALLSIAEVTTYAKTISSPRIITQNRTQASISQGQQILLATAGGVGTAGGFQTVNATLSLSVEPQVTNEGGINLKLSFTESSPGAAVAGASLTTNTKSVDTLVLVDSGATVVIGGVYTSSNAVSEGGIPFLRDIPILGAFFGSKSNSTTKNELFIFVTPRILNEKEAGLRS